MGPFWECLEKVLALEACLPDERAGLSKELRLLEHRLCFGQRHCLEMVKGLLELEREGAALRKAG